MGLGRPSSGLPGVPDLKGTPGKFIRCHPAGQTCYVAFDENDRRPKTRVADCSRDLTPCRRRARECGAAEAERVAAAVFARNPVAICEFTEGGAFNVAPGVRRMRLRDVGRMFETRWRSISRARPKPGRSRRPVLSAPRQVGGRRRAPRRRRTARSSSRGSPGQPEPSQPRSHRQAAPAASGWPDGAGIPRRIGS